MKQFLLILFAAVLCLSGCKNQAPVQPTEGYTAPTLPEFDKTQGPDVHLQAVFDGLRGQSFQASWGSGWREDLTLVPCDTDTLRKLIPNEALVEDFCQRSMIVVPSNDGTFSYQLTGLTVEEACSLICGRSLTEAEQATLSAYTDSQAELTINTDSNRIFRELLLTVTLDQSTWLLQITITLP